MKKTESIPENTFKALITILGIIGIILLATGCQNNKSYVVSGTMVGLKIGVNTDMIPTVKLGYISEDVFILNKDKNVDLDRHYQDISLFGGEGDAGKKIKTTTKEEKNEK